MPRLIDADALPKYTGYALSADEVARAVENALTVDAEPVVRCKDCKYYSADGWGFGNCYRPNVDYLRMKDDSFCSEGEREEYAERIDNP